MFIIISDFSSKLSRILREELTAKNLQVSLLGRKGEREPRSRRCSPPADQPPWIEFSGGAPQIRLICLLWKVFLYLHASCHNKVSQSGLHMCGQAYKSAKSYRQFLALRARRYCEMFMSEKGLKILISALKSESDFHYLSLSIGLLLYLAGHR